MKAKRSKLLTRWGHLRSERATWWSLARSDNISVTKKWTLFYTGRNKGIEDIILYTTTPGQEL